MKSSLEKNKKLFQKLIKEQFKACSSFEKIDNKDIEKLENELKKIKK